MQQAAGHEQKEVKALAKKKTYSETVISAFLKYDKLSDIAKEIGITRQTAAKYRDDPELQRILSDRRMEFVRAAVSRMQAFMVEGVEKLQEIIRDKDTSPQVKVNAIQLMFSQCKVWLDETDVVERLRILEESENNEK